MWKWQAQEKQEGSLSFLYVGLMRRFGREVGVDGGGVIWRDEG